MKEGLSIEKTCSPNRPQKPQNQYQEKKVVLSHPKLFISSMMQKCSMRIKWLERSFIVTMVHFKALYMEETKIDAWNTVKLPKLLVLSGGDRWALTRTAILKEKI